MQYYPDPNCGQRDVLRTLSTFPGTDVLRTKAMAEKGRKRRGTRPPRRFSFCGQGRQALAGPTTMLPPAFPGPFRGQPFWKARLSKGQHGGTRRLSYSETGNAARHPPSEAALTGSRVPAAGRTDGQTHRQTDSTPVARSPREPSASLPKPPRDRVAPSPPGAGPAGRRAPLTLSHCSHCSAARLSAASPAMVPPGRLSLSLSPSPGSLGRPAPSLFRSGAGPCRAAPPPPRPRPGSGPPCRGSLSPAAGRSGRRGRAEGFSGAFVRWVQKSAGSCACLRGQSCQLESSQPSLGEMRTESCLRLQARRGAARGLCCHCSPPVLAPARSRNRSFAQVGVNPAVNRPTTGLFFLLSV